MMKWVSDVKQKDSIIFSKENINKELFCTIGWIEVTLYDYSMRGWYFGSSNTQIRHYDA